MGLFAGSGVGKSVLLGMMARYTSADVIVVGLIGERGREVKEFIEQILGPEGLARSVVVAAPADTWPLMRLQGASYATSIAEYFRDQGKNRDDARVRLAEVIRAAQFVPKKRVATRPTRASKERRIDAKKKRGSIKSGRGSQSWSGD